MAKGWEGVMGILDKLESILQEQNITKKKRKNKNIQEASLFFKILFDFSNYSGFLFRKIGRNL